MKVEKQFGDLVAAIMGSDSFGQAAIKTQISKAYLIEMARGKVPTEKYINMFIDGYKVDAAKANELLVMAGYALPSPVDRATEALKEIPDMATRVQVFLNGSDDLPDFAKQQIREMVLDAWEKRKKEIEESEGA